MVAEQRHPAGGSVKVVGLPVNLSATPGEVGPPAPPLGAHTDDILQSLGYDDADIRRLRDQHTI